MKKLPILLLGLLPLTSLAAEINVQALKACSLVENDFQRLQCFDQVVAGKEVTRSNKKSVPAIVATTVAEPVSSTVNAAPAKEAAKPQANSQSQDNFGLEHKQIEKAGDEISAKVTKVQTKVHGQLLISLDNGHVWQQIGSDRFKVKVGEAVVISRGMFNSFLMQVEGRNRGIKVKRK